jgi:hypothetical protein
VGTKPRRNIGSFWLMRQPRAGGGERVACVTRSPDVEPNHAGSAQGCFRPLYDLLDALTSSAATASGPGMDHARSALFVTMADIAIGKDSLGSGRSLPQQAPRGARS